MNPVVGIFNSWSDAELAISGLHRIGLNSSRINLLTADPDRLELSKIPRTETEQPGTGSAIGGIVGGALGAAGGMSIGSAVASLVVPGVGQILAIGLAAAALFGAGGAVGGAVAGKSLEEAMAPGVPIDELFVYEDALRQGRTLVIAFTDDDSQAERAREAMLGCGAESIDAARENWWIGLRDDRQVGYISDGHDRENDERIFRLGFETALHPKLGRKSFSEAVSDLRGAFPEECAKEPFRRGYEKGYDYYSSLIADRR